MRERLRVLRGAFASSVFALIPMAAGVVLLLAPQSASAHRHRATHHHYVPAHLTVPSKDAALIEDGETGKVLYARNAEEQRYPASLTKIMTLYMLFDALKKGTITMQTPMPVSAHAANQARVRLNLRPGVDTITPEQAIKAIIVRSANDVAVTVAEKLGGTEEHFAEMMTQKAHELGMMHTHYADASGLPNREQVTTAADLGILAHRITYDFPQYFHYFATPDFTWKGHTYPSIDHMLKEYPGTDGMKTGFTDWSGFNLVTSVTRGDVHLIGVVMGGQTGHMRDIEMMHLLDEQFARIATKPTLVAHNDMPWKAFSPDQKPQTMIAGFELPSMTPVPRPAQLAVNATPDLRPAGAVDPNDEEAAESRPDPAADAVAEGDTIANVIAPKPLPRPKPVLAAYAPAKTPAALAGLPGGDASTVASAMTTLGLHDWTIQIGAFTDPKIAREQLESYAEKSMDILGQAERIVAPFKGVNGQTMFRARFGPFAEREARKVCERLTERGQTCFAAVATAER